MKEITHPSLPLPPAGVSAQPRVWLRLEAAVVFTLALWNYAAHGNSWLLFLLLFLVPDASFLAYLAGPRWGALGYNLLHTYVTPAALAVAFHFAGRSLAIPLILTGHIGFDRMLGYGLKYNSGFGSTHLGEIGKTPSVARPE